MCANGCGCSWSSEGKSELADRQASTAFAKATASLAEALRAKADPASLN